ncbi:MAG: redoxin domain-containing protein [Burkholderiaceae bacterium]|nr:redoxin domain-containing protein [Burkholderiaceae bacterium]
MIDETFPSAPPLSVSQWFNAAQPITLDALRGRVVVLHAFQMLCPGCVAHGIPQAKEVHRQFAREEVAVVGLHTVFEHHDAMSPVSLAAFLHEYRVTFPVGVDARADDGGEIPQTMRAYGMRGTPTLVVIDRAGRIRMHAFGRVEDLAVGALIGRLLVER